MPFRQSFGPRLGGFKPKLGEHLYATAVYEKLIRVTITIAHQEREHCSLYLLTSLDVGSDYQRIIEEKILAFLGKYRDQLLEKTKASSEKYAN